MFKSFLLSDYAKLHKFNGFAFVRGGFAVNTLNGCRSLLQTLCNFPWHCSWVMQEILGWFLRTFTDDLKLPANFSQTLFHSFLNGQIYETPALTLWRASNDSFFLFCFHWLLIATKLVKVLDHRLEINFSAGSFSKRFNHSTFSQSAGVGKLNTHENLLCINLHFVTFLKYRHEIGGHFNSAVDFNVLSCKTLFRKWFPLNEVCEAFSPKLESFST